ncbi:MAG: TonB-dependent receptor [Burkholderiales bacterium]|nr:TonB-dependent receptor [Burkholderiales bacterium]
MIKKYLVLFTLIHGTGAGAQTGASALTEQDFLAEMPIVLSVSRLAQRLDDTPGAVTILDRHFIRMSGARDLTDLLRLVPGFQTTTSFETDAPMASYHGRSDDYSNRLQVLVDGRSVYSGYLMGSSGVGLQTLALDDVERIEVLRGTNSAAYGARAFLGVVNIVSRDVRETIGTAVNLAAGENGVADAGARLGWGDSGAAYRVSADKRGDSGLRGAFGQNQIDRFHFSSHHTASGGHEWDVRAGGVDVDAGRGTPGDVGNNARMRYMGARFVQIDWRAPFGDDQDLAITASHTENKIADAFAYLTDAVGAANYGMPLDFSGHDVNDALTLQHTVRHSPALRSVWGTELRREKIFSRAYFDTREQVTTEYARVFGNAEWRILPTVILNAGALVEQSGLGGDTASPRVMLNWRLGEGHTVRAGVSSGFRPPSATEKFAAVRYYGVDGSLLQTTVQATGNIAPEYIRSQELGYNLNLPSAGISADLRVFNERVTDSIATVYNSDPIDFGNIDNYRITGAEWQWSWKPTPATHVFFTQTWTDIAGVAPPVDPFDTQGFRVSHGAPRYAGSLSVMHTFGSHVSVSMLHQRAEETALMSNGGTGPLYSMGRTDLRVGKTFKTGRSSTELALTVQNVDIPYRDGDRKFYFDRRTMVTMRFEN